MRSAGDDPHGAGKLDFNTPHARRLGADDFKRLGTVRAARECHTRGGCEHHPERWPPVFDQGDVDGEFAIPLQELLGAIERVDDEKAVAEYWNVPGSRAFFR